MKITIFKTPTYKYRLFTLKSSKPYIRRELTPQEFKKWWEA